MSNNENSFKTQVDLDIMLNREDNHDIETKKMNLRWNVEFEMRQYGIKSTIITIPDQQVTLSVNVWGDEDDSYEEVTLDIKDVVIERTGTGFDSLVPQKLEFYKNKWTVTF